MFSNIRFYALFTIAVCSVFSAKLAQARGDLEVMGYVENAFFGDLRLEMKAKLDTGAETTSIHGWDVRLYTKGTSDDWVEFRLKGKDGRSVRYDQNVIRFALIKKKEGGTIRRPVIHLPVCIGGKTGLAEVNLADREDFVYDALIGREFLASRIAVDSGSSFLAKEKKCKLPKK